LLEGKHCQGAGVKSLDARFRGHDAAESTDFMRKLPGLIPERRARAALSTCLRGNYAKRLFFQQLIHSPWMPVAVVCKHPAIALEHSQ